MPKLTILMDGLLDATKRNVGINELNENEEGKGGKERRQQEQRERKVLGESVSARRKRLWQV